MKNYYSKPDRENRFSTEFEPEDRPMSINTGGNLVTTYDSSNNKNPIHTTVHLDSQGYYQPNRLGSHHHKHHQDHHQGPQDYLLWSIANVFIFVILALPALFFSVQTREMKKLKNYEKAKYFSKRSLILNIVASVLGLLAITLAIIFRFALYHLFVQNDVQSQNVPLTGG